MRKKGELLLASRRCSQCLTSKNRIVSGARAADLVRDCRARGNHFVCHKGSMAGLNLHCRGMHEIQPSQSFCFARSAGIPIVEIDPDTITEEES